MDNEKSQTSEPRAKQQPHVKRRLELFVPPISLDRASKVPLHRQIHLQIAQAIRSGSIQYEARLPSTRMMAGLLGVSRNTVLAAVRECRGGRSGAGRTRRRNARERRRGVVVRAAECDSGGEVSRQSSGDGGS